MTVTIQIGNSDDKLSQAEWSEFVAQVRAAIMDQCNGVHFAGGSSNWERWQNFTWVIEITEVKRLQQMLRGLREHFRQDSVAWTEGKTHFL